MHHTVALDTASIANTLQQSRFPPVLHMFANSSSAIGAGPGSTGCEACGLTTVGYQLLLTAAHDLTFTVHVEHADSMRTFSAACWE